MEGKKSRRKTRSTTEQTVKQMSCLIILSTLQTSLRNQHFSIRQQDNLIPRAEQKYPDFKSSYIEKKKSTSCPQTHPEASPCPQPGCPSGLAGWLAPWWCLSRCSCQLAGCCGSASRSSRCGTPAGSNRTGAGLESRGCGDSAHSGRTPQYAGEDQRDEKDYDHDSTISDTFHRNTFKLDYWSD